jgi:hypothetical protein
VYVNLTYVDSSNVPIENAKLIAEEMTGWLREVEGFKGLMVLSREGSSIGLAFWESREVAERHSVLRRQFVERITFVADLKITDMVDYDITFAHLAPDLLDFTA